MTKSAIFQMSDKLTFHTVQQDRQRLVESLKVNHQKMFCVDLSDVQHCDSAGLALLLEAKRLCMACGQELTWVGMTPEMYALAEFCGLKSIL